MKIGLVYSFNAIKTHQQAKKIVKAFGKGAEIEEVDAMTAQPADILKFENLIFGIPTWFDGELPSYWDELLPGLSSEAFVGKKIALYGGGDQKGYPENFVDGLGLMANFLEQRGASLVGFTSTEGYTFERSKALRDNKFVGLALDIENQSGLTTTRIEEWVAQLMKEFKK